MIPSAFQLDIYKNVENSTANLQIEAVAGSGKTTTIIEALKFVPINMRVLFLAFNKHIVTTLKDRVPLNVEVATLNSFGFGIVRNFYGRVKVDAEKSKTCFWFEIARQDKRTFAKYCSPVCKLVSLFKAYGMEKPTNADIDFLIDHYEIDTDQTGIEYALSTHYACDSKAGTIDFDDQLYLPIVRKMPIPSRDLVFVDEAQDLNPIQIELIRRIGARVVAVGDSKQAIYGFRGADPEAMHKMREIFKADTLPLSICYRCAKEIVRKAQEVVPYIEYSDTQEEGVVEYISTDDYRKQIRDDDFVLCRTTAPLVSEALKMIASGRKACVLGREIGKNLLDLVKRISPNSEITMDDIDRYEYEQTQKFANKEAKIIALQDQIETIKALHYAYGAAGIEQAVTSLFSDATVGITYCTVHKAKGLERDRVYILKPELLPHPRCTQGWQKTQEENLKYVAITRAKKELYFISENVSNHTGESGNDSNRSVPIDPSECSSEDCGS